MAGKNHSAVMQIDLYTEITCPWCFVGHHRLDKVLAERFPHLTVDIRQHRSPRAPDDPRIAVQPLHDPGNENVDPGEEVGAIVMGSKL